MQTTHKLKKNAKLPDSTDGLSRRHVLMTATVAASTLAGAPSVLADTVPAGTFGAPAGLAATDSSNTSNPK